MKILKKFKLTRKKLIMVAILAMALGGFFFFRARNKKEVAVATVQRGNVREELVLTGAVKAEKHINLSFPTSGKISWVGVAEGQKVYKGQGLASLDRTVLNSAYQQALNTYKDKQAAAEKVEDDVKDHSSDETFAQKSTRTTAQVARDSAYDAVTAAEYNLKNATILAPFAGIVTSLPFPFPGVNISVTDRIVEILDPATVYFEVDADQNEVTNIKVGQEVTVVFDSFSGKELNGKVTFVAFTPKAGETGTVYKIKIKFMDTVSLDSDSIKIGMTGDARFTLSQKEDVLFVPAEFVISDTTGKYLRLGKVSNKTYIETGLIGEERIEIVSDKVEEGDIVYD